MTWFKVDDSFHSHPKAMAVSLAALGLWAVAGSWSGDHLTDGFIPDHMIPPLSRGQGELANELCAAGLWRRCKGGYRFHQWHEDADGTVRNPSREDVTKVRVKRAEAGRKGGLASGKSRSKPGSKPEANASAPASRIVEPPTRPDPSFSPPDGALQESPPAPPGPPKGPRGSRLPDDFVVTPEMATWAREKTPSCGPADHDAFRDYWRGIAGAKGRKADWTATWRNWMRREHERRSRPTPNSQRRTTADDRIADIQALKTNPPTSDIRPLNLIRGELA